MTCGLLYLSHSPRWVKLNRATAEGELCRAISDPRMDRRRLTLLNWSRRSFVISFSYPAFQMQGGGIAGSVTHAHGTAQRA